LNAENKANTGGNPARAWLLAFIGWLLPGFGHLGQGHVFKGLLGGTTIIISFLAGTALGGHIYTFQDSGEGLLSILFGFCNLGSGLLYILSRMTGFAVSEQPALATSEYGNIFLMAAGLLNFILALDAFDIGAGRKS
jgi:hypothetical protein